jgi:hypothetical protein
MNSNINEITKVNYSLEDAFQIISSIINTEREKYENIINTMNQKINELKTQLDQLKDENSKYKNKIIELQNQFVSISNTISQLNEVKDNKALNENKLNLYSSETFDKNNSEKTINNNDQTNRLQNEFKSLNNKDDNINNYISIDSKNNINSNFVDKDLNKQNNNFQQYKLSLNRQLFNKKLVKKNNSFNLLTKNKNISKSFNNQNHIPVKIVRNNNDIDGQMKNNYSQSSYNLISNNLLKSNGKIINNAKTERRSFENYVLENYSNKKNNTQRDKFNNIERKIKNMKSGLSIYNLDRNKTHFENREFYNNKFKTYTLNNKENDINFENN